MNYCQAKKVLKQQIQINIQKRKVTIDSIRKKLILLLKK